MTLCSLLAKWGLSLLPTAAGRANGGGGEGEERGGRQGEWRKGGEIEEEGRGEGGGGGEGRVNGGGGEGKRRRREGGRRGG